MEVKPGYKHTNVGLIPSDWLVLPVDEITTEFRGGAPFKPSDFTSGGIKVLPKGGVGRNGVLRVADKDLQYCSNGYANAHPRNQVDKTYTIIVLRDLVPSGPSIGLMVEIASDERFVLAQGVYGFKVDCEKVDARYLIQLSNTRWYRNLVNSIMVGSTQVHITNTTYKKAELPIPPLPEQRAISAALSDVDTLLASLDRLIAKKRDLKKAAMQQLLTGQTRLSGFSGEWLRTELKQLVSTPITDGPHLTPTFYETGVPFLSVNNLTNNRIDLTDLRFISRADDEIFSRKCKPRKGDVLLGKAASVGKVAIVEDDLDFNIWSPIALVRSGETLDAKFLYYQLLSTDSITQVTLLTNSSSQGNIGMGDIEKIQISYPCVGEQIAISKVLTSIDMEISALESRRNKIAALKQGMMQELLTGRTRLV